jgi:hypothetical protein
VYFQGTRLDRMGNRDKHKRKEMIGFEPDFHPVLRMFETLSKRMVEPVLKVGLDSIVECGEKKPEV